MKRKCYMINPVMHYKLDPGEFGIPFPARASQSTVRVASQELGNLNRFKMEAMRKGGRVVYSKITLNPQLEGPFMATASGKTEVRIAYPKEEKPVVPEQIPPYPELPDEEEKPEDILQPSNLDEIVQGGENKDQELINKLERAERILEAKLNNIKLQKMKLRGDNTADAERERQKLEKLEKETEEKLKNIEQNITDLSLQKGTNKPKALNNLNDRNALQYIPTYLSSTPGTGMFLKGLMVNLVV